jgi:hypothetical protein
MLVNVLISEEYRIATNTRLVEWQKLQGSNSSRWTMGHNADGRCHFIDIPTAAVEYLRQCGIPLDTVPRDPLRRVASW